MMLFISNSNALYFHLSFHFLFLYSDSYFGSFFFVPFTLFSFFIWFFIYFFFYLCSLSYIYLSSIFPTNLRVLLKNQLGLIISILINDRLITDHPAFMVNLGNQEKIREKAPILGKSGKYQENSVTADHP